MMKIFLLFYMCDFAVGLTHCYKTTVFLHLFNTRPDIQHTVDKMILSDMDSLRRKLDFPLLMHTEGSGKLNISMHGPCER